MRVGTEIQGHLIEERAYARVRDVAEALGYKVAWRPPDLVTILESPRAIAQDTDLRLPSQVSAELLDQYLKGSPLAGLGKDFVDLEEVWRVNAVFTCAVACHESNFGTSLLATTRHNLFGYMAYDSNPDSAKAYPTYHASVEDFCRLISREYLNPAGSFYEGPTVAGVAKKYASDPGWSGKVLEHCKAILALQGK